MNYLLKIVSNIMAIVGFIIIMGAGGASDHASYYGQSEPEGLNTLLIVGLLLIIPAVINMIYRFLKEYIL